MNACTYPRRVEAASPLAASDPATRSMSSAVTSHAGQPSIPSTRSSTPVSFSIVTGLNPRATHDARYASTHSSWNRTGSAATGTPAAARLPPITRNPGLSTPHTFLTPEKTR